MSDKNQSSGKTISKKGYTPSNNGYQPSGGNVTGGFKPEKSELKPTNPPQKK